MSKIDVIRAWKDEEYLASLSDAERAMLPENPAGYFELTDVELESVAGAQAAQINGIVTLGCSYLFCTYMWPVCTIPSL
jgi:mersacidin/lichenicidin family type 2 lantibiotic